MSELKVCAHCGHEAARKELRYYGETETWAYCPNPDCPMHDRTMTIKAWQTRPIEDALNARIAELESLVEQLIWVGNDLLVSNTNPVTIMLFNGLVCNAKEREE